MTGPSSGRGGRHGLRPCRDASDFANNISRPRFHLVTFMNRLDRHFAYLQVSAEAHALNPKVIGYGLDAWWPDGLGAKINALRDFAFKHVADGDVLLFADAFDVLIFGAEEEIVSRFEDLERVHNSSLLFNAEEYCYPRLDGVCDPDSYPPSKSRWRYLNSGLILGRGRAIKEMLRDPVPSVIKGSDQMWYQQRFRNHSKSMLLDTNCYLLCAITGLQRENGVGWLGKGADTRLEIQETGATPSVVHFVSVAHWPAWRGEEGQPTTALHDAFRRLYPFESERLLDNWRIEAHLGTTHTITAYDGPGLYWVFRLVLCTQCRLLGSTQNECMYFPSLVGGYCLVSTLILGAVLAGLILLCNGAVRSYGRAALSRAGAIVFRPWRGSRYRKLPEMLV